MAYMSTMSNRTIGVLLDVSGSMQNTYALTDRASQANVQRINAIITSIINIVKSEVGEQNRGEIFAVAFGLGNQNCCDLIALLDLVAGPKYLRQYTTHDALARIAADRGAAHVQGWIRDHLTEKEAHNLLKLLCFDQTLIHELIRKLPDRYSVGRAGANMASWIPFFGNRMQGSIVHRSEGYHYAQELIKNKKTIIERALANIQYPKTKSVEYVATLLEDLDLHERDKQTHNLQEKIRELIAEIDPYIYGRTPMCEAITTSGEMFRVPQQKEDKNILFILTDGDSTDGDPVPLARDLIEKDKKVIIVTCFITSKSLASSRVLFDQEEQDWRNGECALFNMSSVVSNFEPPITYLVDAGWTLPASGESRLFVRANSVEVVDEICEVVVRNLGKKCDGIVEAIGKINLAKIISNKNESFIPRHQESDTCYANAIGAVYKLAMLRIVGRDGVSLSFQEIYDKLILQNEQSQIGIPTGRLVKESCSQYRLKCQEVDEAGARRALIERRPLVARFAWSVEEKEAFEKFFRESPDGILTERAMQCGPSQHHKIKGHAVVLIRCAPKYLLFINSWGTDWGNNGFFKLENSKVMRKMKFWDVYWDESDLSAREKQAFRDSSIRTSKKHAHKYPSVMNLPFECVMCKGVSKIKEYKGNLFKAKCPRCAQEFEPTNEDLAKTLYLKST